MAVVLCLGASSCSAEGIADGFGASLGVRSQSVDRGLWTGDGSVSAIGDLIVYTKSGQLLGLTASSVNSQSPSADGVQGQFIAYLGQQWSTAYGLSAQMEALHFSYPSEYASGRHD